MAISWVQQKDNTNGSGSQTSSAVTLTGNTVTGNLLVATFTGNTTGTDVSGITDTQGNSWAVASPRIEDSGGPIWNAMWYAVAKSSAACTITATFSASTATTDMRVSEYTGVDTLDQHTGRAQSGDPATTATVTTTVANELLIGSIGVMGIVTGFGTGWNSLTITSPNANSDEYQIVSAIGAYAASFHVSGSPNNAVQMATFYKGTGAPPFTWEQLTDSMAGFPVEYLRPTEITGY